MVVSSVEMEEPFITKDLLDNAAIFTHKFFIDLSVPRSISPNIEEVPGVLLYNIDDIRNKTTAALKKRMEAVPAVEAIVEEAIKDFYSWSKENDCVPYNQ